ncbi:hypothetical protein L596_021666 [Steinernema carpocapsae]|uniref:Uncharacterized protein n=1 Tax=Steinernema carpocapsae TaxID=34508 RepID=A0A4U5MJG9_STECR|nr:hypothetical protein L596_021666 [Steinernema carpocapsae]
MQSYPFYVFARFYNKLTMIIRCVLRTLLLLVVASVVSSQIRFSVPCESIAEICAGDQDCLQYYYYQDPQCFNILEKRFSDKRAPSKLWNILTGLNRIPSGKKK